MGNGDKTVEEVRSQFQIWLDFFELVVDRTYLLVSDGDDRLLQVRGPLSRSH